MRQNPTFMAMVRKKLNRLNVIMFDHRMLRIYFSLFYLMTKGRSHLHATVKLQHTSMNVSDNTIQQYSYVLCVCESGQTNRSRWQSCRRRFRLIDLSGRTQHFTWRNSGKLHPGILHWKL